MSAVTVIDTVSLYHASEAIAGDAGSQKRPAPRYDVLRRALERFRTEAGWPRPTTSLALAAISRTNAQQRLFVEALQRARFTVNDIDFRQALISAPPSPSRRDTDGRTTPSFSARIAYIAGLLAHDAGNSLLLVGHSFELYAPLFDLSHRIKGVGIAHFRSVLEYRWQRVEAVHSGIQEGRFRFFDLDPLS
jgi:hypothetical protein